MEQFRGIMIAYLSAMLVAGCMGGYDSAMSMGDYEDSYYEPPSAAAPDTEETAPESQDQFLDVGVNPFVSVGHDPFSTFAADVDTASYDILRQWMMTNDVAPAASVRLEEYVNYFDYEYPAPDADSEHPFAISLASAPHPLNRGTLFLRVGIQAQAAPLSRPQANLVFLIDISGSMDSPEKLGLVQQLLTNAVHRLQPEDTISLVTYAGGTSVRLPPTPVSEASTITSAINDLNAGGSTAGAAGIELAYAQAEAAFIEDGINQVILCTDGDFNIGVSSTDGLVSLIEEKRRGGVTLTALGFGRGNLNDAMMELVSNAGNGIYSVIYNEERAIEYLERHLLSSIVHVAKDMKIQVEFNPDEVMAYRLLGYVNRAIADDDFRNDAVDAGEVGAGHRVTALYEVVLNGGTIPTPDGAPEPLTGEPIDGDREIGAGELVRVKVRYKDVGASEEDPAYEVANVLSSDELSPGFDAADGDFQWAVAVAMFAELVQDSPFVTSDAWDLIEAISGSQAGRDDVRAEFAALVPAVRAISF